MGITNQTFFPSSKEQFSKPEYLVEFFNMLMELETWHSAEGACLASR